MADSTAKDNRFGWLRAPLGFRRDWEGWGEGIDTDPDIAERKDERRMTRVLFINMVDSMKKALIWRGEATGTISDSKEKEEKQVLKSIHKMFKQFPPGEK